MGDYKRDPIALRRIWPLPCVYLKRSDVKQSVLDIKERATYHLITRLLTIHRMHSDGKLALNEWQFKTSRQHSNTLAQQSSGKEMETRQLSHTRSNYFFWLDAYIVTRVLCYTIKVLQCVLLRRGDYTAVKHNGREREREFSYTRAHCEWEEWFMQKGWKGVLCCKEEVLEQVVSVHAWAAIGSFCCGGKNHSESWQFASFSRPLQARLPDVFVYIMVYSMVCPRIYHMV